MFNNVDELKDYLVLRLEKLEADYAEEFGEINEEIENGDFEPGDRFGHAYDCYTAGEDSGSYFGSIDEIRKIIKLIENIE